MGFWQGIRQWLAEKRQWLTENWKPLAALMVLGLLPFLGFIFSGKALVASDQMGAPAWRYYFEAIRHGSIPWWNPYGLGGMPTFDAGYGDGAYPLFILVGLLFPIQTFISYSFLLHVLIGGLAAYYLVNRFFCLGRMLSLALAAAYMFNANFLSHIYSGHTGKFYLLAWLPLSLYFLLRSLTGGARWYHSLGLALTLSLFLLTNHLQMTYFALMGYFLAWAFKTFWLVKEKRVPAAALTAARFWMPILLGIGLVFFMFYPPKQYTKDYSVRGAADRTTFEHATSWSMHPEEVASLVVPEFTGILEKYWGRNPFKLNSEYPGLSVIFLAILGLVLFRRAREGWFWFWAGVGVLAVIFSLGAHTPLFLLFYKFIPGIKLFRAPGMMIFWLGAALLIMSADALSRLTGPRRDLPEAKARAAGKRLLQVGLGLAGVLALCGVMPNAVFGAWDAVFGGEPSANAARQAQAASAFGGGALRSALLLAALVYSAWRWLLLSNQGARFGLALLAVTCIDLYWTDSHFIKTFDPARNLPREAVVDYLKADTSAFRLYGLPGAYDRWFMQYHRLETTDGWADNEYRIYREFRDSEGNYQRNDRFMAGLKQNPDGTVSGSAFLDMLNVKYLLFRAPEDNSLRMAVNAGALPRAWMVPAWRGASDTAAMGAMQQPGFDPRRLAYVSPAGAVPDLGNPEDTLEAGVARLERSPNAQSYAVKAARAGLLVVSDLWFPHWRVQVDGRPAQLLRVNYALRGVLVPAGDHRVAFAYHSPWLATGFAVAAGSAVLLVAFLFGLAKLAPRLEKP